MKDYIIEVKDGHHHVRMLTDEEMDLLQSVKDFIQRAIDNIREFVASAVESISNWIEENIDLEKLKELDYDKHSTEQIRHSVSADTAGEAGLIYARCSRN